MILDILLTTFAAGDYHGRMKNLRYPIRAVSKLTGLSIDTLRAWERRYQAVHPKRDERGRLYSEADIKRLQMLHAVVERGHAIGRVSHLSDGQLESLLARLRSSSREAAPSDSSGPAQVCELSEKVLEALVRFDAAAADRELGRLALLLPPRDLIRGVVLPLLQTVGLEWQEGRLGVAQEHLVSALLRNLLGALLRQVARNGSTVRMIFATLSGELHELGALAAALLASSGGLDVMYLGPGLPPEEIIAAARSVRAGYVVLGMTGANGIRQATHNLRRIAGMAPSGPQLWVGGARSEQLLQAILDTPVTWIEDFDRLERELKNLGARL